jgi:hypothetical protein
MAVVGNNIDVGNKPAARNPGQPVIERLARTDGAPKLRLEAPNTVRIKRSVNCGAMSQQGGDSGNYSTPQKFVQLVGCRDPKASSEPWVRPGPAKP